MKIEHDSAGNRFVATVDGGEAELGYMERGGAMDLHHTYVPTEARGQGIADQLAEAAFAYARQQGHKVIPTCPFVAAWVEKHPDQKDLVSG